MRWLDSRVRRMNRVQSTSGAVGSDREMVGFMHEMVESPKEMDRAAREVLGFMREMVISANGTAGSAREMRGFEMLGLARVMIGFAQ